MTNVEERFWVKVDKNGPEGCWVWTKATNDLGYGWFSFNRQPHLAHRIAWMLTHGEMPNGLVLHSCDNPPCVNPNHLRVGTDQDNSDDKVARNRCAKGLSHPKFISTDELARQVKSLDKQNLSSRKIATILDVSPSTVSRILRGRR